MCGEVISVSLCKCSLQRNSVLMCDKPGPELEFHFSHLLIIVLGHVSLPLSLSFLLDNVENASIPLAELFQSTRAQTCAGVQIPPCLFPDHMECISLSLRGVVPPRKPQVGWKRDSQPWTHIGVTWENLKKKKNTTLWASLQTSKIWVSRSVALEPRS